jgi:hypothetical protein
MNETPVVEKVNEGWKRLMRVICSCETYSLWSLGRQNIYDDDNLVEPQVGVADTVG